MAFSASQLPCFDAVQKLPASNAGARRTCTGNLLSSIRRQCGDSEVRFTLAAFHQADF
jgi:hypothetical protein